MNTKFAHLHVHTELSALDGLASIHEYVHRAKELGQPALAITDHGNICGAPEFYLECRKNDIEPIIGSEFYFVPDSNFRPANKKDEDYERHHVTILAKGAKGYEVLAALSTESHKRYWYKPLLDRELLESLGDDAKHLVVLSGCAGSILSRKVRAGDADEVAHELYWWREHFPNYYIELMDHSTDFDQELNYGLLEVAKKFDLSWVITNDPHYAVPEDECHHDTLLAIQTASDIDDPNRFKFHGTGYHLRSRQEMRKAFKKYGDEVWKPGAANTLAIAKACQTRIPNWEKRSWQIPKFPDAEDAQEMLKELCKQGLKERRLHKKTEYVERTKEELKIIKQVGIADFLLITRDFIEWAKDQGIPVGPGRGSVCGSLVGLLIGIHKIDPIRYELLFERFLNPARPRMPDIDTDFGQERREELFAYVQEKYGRENVIHVAAYQTMKLKSAFKSLAKGYGITFAESNRISKMFANDDEAEDVLPEEIQKAYPELAAQMTRLAGTKKGVSTHPAGVIIADPKANIRHQVPEMWIPNTKRWVGQYDLEAAEMMGLMKEDFLGLRTLDTIKQCIDLIKENTGEEIDPDSWVPDEEERDEEVYAMLAEGRTSGVFQMEGATNQRGCRDVNPTCFEDIVSITSLYRTGAISAGFPKVFNENRKKGKKNIKYAHPKLKPILEETWGVVLYQEQVMEFGRQLAGFDMLLVDDIKEAIKHKKSTFMQSLKPAFVEGCIKHSGIERKIAEQIWHMIEGYSGYGYNRSHAVAYTFTTYQTARLKLLYPLEYTSSLLRTVSDKEKRDVYIREAAELGYKMLPPDINISDPSATPDYEAGGIRFGLGDVAGIGEKSIEKLLRGREEGYYTSPEEVEGAVRNKGMFQKLKDSGALESLGIPASEAKQEELLKWSFNDHMEKWRKKFESAVELPEFDGDEVVIVGEVYKVERRKTKNDKPYLNWKLRWSVTQSFDVRLWSETQEHWNYPKGSIVMVTGRWDQKWLNVSISDPDNIRLVKRGKE